MSHRSGSGCSLSRPTGFMSGELQREVAGERWLQRYISLAKGVGILHRALSASHAFILYYGKVSGVFKLC
jgi:hypothetical protein